MRTALVSGASGFIGRRVAMRLVANGFRVIALSRRPDVFSADVQVHPVDLATGAGLRTLPSGDLDVVYHCAGEIRHPPLMRALHVDGTSRLIDVLPAGRPVHWIQLSSVGAYGPPLRRGEARVVTEQTAEHPVGEYEVTKTEADHLVQRAASDGRITLAVLRPANVIGHGMPNASLPRIIDMVRRRLFVFIGAPGALSNYVHVDDVVTALMLCATHPSARGVFNLSSDCTWEALVARIAHHAQVPVPRIRVPETVMRALGGRLGAALGNPLTGARINALTGRTRYSTRRIESELGFVFTKPMPDGIADLMVSGSR